MQDSFCRSPARSAHLLVHPQTAEWAVWTWNHEVCCEHLPGHRPVYQGHWHECDAIVIEKRLTSKLSRVVKYMRLTLFPMKSVVGSCRKVSRMVISASSFCRKRPRVISQVLRKGPKDAMWVGKQWNRMCELPTVVSVSTKCVYHVMGQAEWNDLGFFERLTLLKSIWWEQ